MGVTVTSELLLSALSDLVGLGRGTVVATDLARSSASAAAAASAAATAAAA